MKTSRLTYFRSLVFAGLLIPLTCIFAGLSVIAWCLPDRWAYSMVTIWSRITIYLAKHLCGIDYEVRYKHNLPTSPTIVLCKHQSAWETIFMQTLLPRQTWVLKRELLWIPFFGWGLARLKPIAIARGQARSFAQLINKGAQALKNGRWVVIFPEGTRVKPGEKKRYSRSGALLAQHTKYPVVLIAHNAGQYWPKNGFLKHAGKVIVEIGPTLKPSDYANPQMLNEEAAAWIEETTARLEAED